MQDIIDKRIDIEAIALSIKGVVGVGIGLSKQGDQVIKILVSNEFDKTTLPKKLIASNIELEHVGDIKAQ